MHHMMAFILAAICFVPLCQGTITVAITKSNPVTSSYKPGVSLIDDDLSSFSSYPTAVNNAKTLIRAGLGFQNQFIQAWGMGDVWPQPPPTQTDVDSTRWSFMDWRVNLTVGSNVTPIISLCEAPWWMKGQLNADLTTTLLTSSDEYAGIAYASRILDNHMSSWLLLVQRTAERYMAPPYNVRYFQVWNEMKGYYNPKANRWDYNTSAGVPSGPNAQHGYTYMYNQVYARIKQVATNLGIAQSSVHVGGPYVVIDSWSSTSVESNPSSVSGPWGNFDKRWLDVVSYWLAHKTGAEFISLDGGLGNRDKSIATDFVETTKFAAAVNWVRTQSGGASLPVVWSEFYVDMDTSKSAYNDTYSNALKSYALAQLIPLNVQSTLFWGGNWPSGNRGLWTPCSSNLGGVPTTFYTLYKNIGTYFGAGKQIYHTTVSGGTSIAALASRNEIMLVNLSGASAVVSVDSQPSITLTAHQVKFVTITWW